MGATPAERELDNLQLGLNMLSAGETASHIAIGDTTIREIFSTTHARNIYIPGQIESVVPTMFLPASCRARHVP